MPRKIEISKEFLIQEYIENNRTIEDIATSLGCEKRVVSRRLQEYGIKKEFSDVLKTRQDTNRERYGYIPDGEKQKRIPLYEKIQREEIFDLYINNNFNIEELAEYYNVCKSTINFTLKYFGIIKSSELIQERREKTCIKKYGFKSSSMNSEVRKKQENTNMERYGVKNPLSSKGIQQKVEQTCIEKYGVKSILSYEGMREKIKRTFLEKYGSDNPGLAHLSPESKEITSSREKLRSFMEENNIHSVKELANSLGRGSCPKMGAILHKFDSWDLITPKESFEESQIFSFISSLGIKCQKDRSVLSPLEIDCYCPDQKIGIEFNGTYWHSSIFKDKNYHYKKSLIAKACGVRLVHVYEHEWTDKRTRPIVESILKIALGHVDKRIYARQCEIREISNEEALPFLQANHLQGARIAKITLGLFYNGSLVQLMSFSHNRKYEWEIIRECSLLNTLIVGGSSKLFKYFINKYNPSEIFSYADFNKFSGKGYESLGMEHIGYTGPDMCWIIEGEVYNRNPHEHKKMKELADAQLWGAGSQKFLWKNKQ